LLGILEGQSAAKNILKIVFSRRKCEMEKWKDIKGYENLYQISDLGRIKSLGGTWLNSQGKGYNKTNSGKYRARYKYKGKEKHLGTFETEEEAKEVYLNAINKLKNKGKKPIKILKQNKTAGYYRVALCKNNIIKHKFVHKIVAENFLIGGGEINHKNCNTLDNRVYNLEYITKSENMKHAIKNNCMNGKPKKIKCLDNGIVFESIYKAAEWINKDGTKKIKTVATRISRQARGFSKIAYGYHFKILTFND
jgi:hypothetical protein